MCKFPLIFLKVYLFAEAVCMELTYLKHAFLTEIATVTKGDSVKLHFPRSEGTTSTAKIYNGTPGLFT